MLPKRPIVAQKHKMTMPNQHARQIMMPTSLMKLLLPKVCVKIRQWNVRTVFERGKCAQKVNEMRRYGISILEISEMGR